MKKQFLFAAAGVFALLFVGTVLAANENSQFAASNSCLMAAADQADCAAEMRGGNGNGKGQGGGNGQGIRQQKRDGSGNGQCNGQGNGQGKRNGAGNGQCTGDQKRDGSCQNQ